MAEEERRGKSDVAEIDVGDNSGSGVDLEMLEDAVQRVVG